jgi:hypothetical protein
VVYASLDVALDVCVCPQHLPGHVGRAVREALTGRGGFFSPDRFTFGDHVFLSQILAAVMGVTGVLSVSAARFRRTDQPDAATASNVAAGRITVGRFEIARLDNDPNFPEHGTLGVTCKGGR